MSEPRLPTGILTGLARIPLGLLDLGEACGLDRRALMEAAGLDEAALGDPDARVGVAAIWELWRSIIEGTDDSNLGLRLGQRFQLESLGIVGYSLKYSSTLHRAFERLARYSQIVTEAVRFRLTERDGEVNVSIERHQPFDALRHPVDARLAMLITLARGLTQSEIDPLQVRFSYPRPGETKEYERCFRAPLRFDAQVAGISFRTSDLERPVVSADEVLDGYLDRYAEDLLAKLASGDTVAKVVLRTMWGQLSGGQVDLATTSRHLGMSSRTLQRRLRDEDTSFAELLDLFRREASQRLLKDRGLAVEEVAFMLGYSEPSTFYRAFRRWTGLTPRRFRHSA